jgi:tetratricopeptide (TPR) repeat protein
MKERHPHRESLEQFVVGEISGEDARSMERHLEVCPDCRDRIDEITASAKHDLLESWLSPGYEDAIERAVDGAAERLIHIVHDGRGAETLLTELLKDPAPARRRKVRSEERFHTPKLGQLLQARSRDAWFFDPSAALEYAELAVLVAERLDSGRYGMSLVEDARAMAWGHLGNAFRIRSDLWRAEQALRQAWLHHARAGEDAYTETELLKFTSSLRSLQGRLEQAVLLCDRSIVLYREGQDRHLEGAALIMKGAILADHSCFQEAIPVTREGLSLVDPAEDPRLILMGNHNLTLFVANTGAPRVAKKFLVKSRSLYQDLGEPIILARLRWLEGNIAAGLGRLGEAERVLREVRDFFVDRELGIEVAVASLELAEVYLKGKRPRLAREAAGELIPLGESLGLHQLALVARLLFAQASRG